jgi:hypothetical protein
MKPGSENGKGRTDMRPSLNFSRYSGICGSLMSRLLFLPRMYHLFSDNTLL